MLGWATRKFQRPNYWARSEKGKELRVARSGLSPGPSAHSQITGFLLVFSMAGRRQALLPELTFVGQEPGFLPTRIPHRRIHTRGPALEESRSRCSALLAILEHLDASAREPWKWTRSPRPHNDCVDILVVVRCSPLSPPEASPPLPSLSHRSINHIGED